MKPMAIVIMFITFFLWEQSDFGNTKCCLSYKQKCVKMAKTWVS